MTGYFVFGQNPAGGGMNAGLQRAGLRNLEWLVVADWFETESAVFWKNDPTGPPPSRGQDRGVLPPRRRQPGEGRHPDQHPAAPPVAQQGHRPARRLPLGRLVRLPARQAAQGAVRRLHRPQGPAAAGPHLGLRPRPRAALPDGTTSRIDGEPDIDRMLMEINGYKLDEIDPATGRPRLLRGFSELKDDGSTACGCWIYSGVFPEAGPQPGQRAQAQRQPGAARLGVRLAAQPPGDVQPRLRRPGGPALVGAEEADLVGRGEAALGRRRRAGLRAGQAARLPPGRRGQGMAAIAGDQPFIMKTDGLGWLYAPKGVKDGPLPAHYEPVESPVGNLLYPRQPASPTVRTFDGPLNRLAHAPTAEYPVVAITFRLTEHYLSGPMSRFNSWLNELQPEMFVELSPELAAERGVANGDWVTVRSARGAIEARAMVTRRIRPLRVDGRVIHQVGLPFHWAFAGEAVGGNANDLTALLAEVNVSMHEGKAFACQVEAGRLAGPRAEPTAGAAGRPASRSRTPPPRPARRGIRPWELRQHRLGLPQARPHAAGGFLRAPARAVPARPRAGPEAGHRVLHRHDGVHRLQGVRGGVQAVEPAPRRRLPLVGQQLRQHRGALGLVVAARQVRRAVPRPGGAGGQPRLSLDVRARPGRRRSTPAG